jgi:hypothetical protein
MPARYAASSAAPAAWRIRLQTVFWFVLAAAFVAGLPVLLGWSRWVPVVLMVLAAVLAMPSAWLLRRLSSAASARSPGAGWLRATIGWTFLLGAAVSMPVYYLAAVTNTRPATIPQVALSNGPKRVIFQGMQHIASENFYKAVIYDVEKSLSEGHVLYYEGVQTGSPESKAFFGQLANELTGGGQDLSETYKSIGQLCGMQFQLDYFGLLDADKAAHPERHVIADVDALEIKAEYQRLMREDPAFAKAHAGDFQGKPAASDSQFMQRAVQWLKNGSPSQQALGGIACRGLWTLLLQAPGDKAPGHMDAVVLDFRNRALAQRIMQAPHDKIFITYGSAHLPGLLAELRKIDPRWGVGSVKWLRTIEAPQHLEGQLRGIDR